MGTGVGQPVSVYPDCGIAWDIAFLLFSQIKGSKSVPDSYFKYFPSGTGSSLVGKQSLSPESFDLLLSVIPHRSSGVLVLFY